MATISLKNLTEIKDFVRGCTFYGTGGGGSPADGIKSLEKVLNTGKRIEWVDKDDINEEGFSVCPFLMGSIAPWTEEVKKEMESFGLVKQLDDNVLSKAVELLAKYMDIEPKVIVPIELGGANTPTAVAAAAELGIKVVDGDYTGRAIPEIPQTTPFLHDKKLFPISSWDRWGDICYIEDAVNPLMAERIGKLISAAAYGLTGQAGFLMSIKEMKDVVIPGTLTECYEVGKLIREAREAGRDPVEALTERQDIQVLFKGKISDKNWEDKNGYYWGTHDINGVGKYKGDNFRIWFKNENHVSWYNSKPFVTSPDMLIVVRSDDGEPLANPQIEVGLEVTVIGIPAREEFLTDKGISILGPRHFGYDIEYRPFKEVLSR